MKKPKPVPRWHQKLPRPMRVLFNPWMKKRGDRGDRNRKE